jgi:hypothetical protein
MALHCGQLCQVLVALVLLQVAVVAHYEQRGSNQVVLVHHRVVAVAHYEQLSSMTD